MADQYGESAHAQGLGSGRKFAVITGGSSGIGKELAKLAASDGYDLLLAADMPDLEEAVDELQAQYNVKIESVQADLATVSGVDQLEQAIAGREVSVLVANAGHGLGGAFLDQDFREIQHVIDTNVTGTIDLIHRVGRTMREANAGRILIVGSIAGIMPGAYQAVYHGTKAFIDNFAFALRNELKDTEVKVTLLMPGATDTDFFDRAEMEDTKVGQSEKQDPAEVADSGWKAMLKGEDHVVAGWQNKLMAAIAQVTPSTTLAEMNATQNQPEHVKG